MEVKEFQEWLKKSNWKYDEKDNVYRLGIYRSLKIVYDENGEMCIDFTLLSSIDYWHYIIKVSQLRYSQEDKKNGSLEYDVVNEDGDLGIHFLYST